MTTVGAYEAKTHLPHLLERVARGEKILITRHGRPAAMLVPPTAAAEKDVRQVIEEFKAYSRRQKRTLGDVSAREAIEEGRRY
jgi:prevent-host-death family protein